MSSSESSTSTTTKKQQQKDHEQDPQDQQQQQQDCFTRPNFDQESCSDGGDSSQQQLNPTVDLLSEGIVGLLRPSLEGLDVRVAATRTAQDQLRAQIQELGKDLEVIQRAEAGAGAGAAARDGELEAAIEKLNNAKKRVVVVANLLQGAQDRLNRVHHNCLKETARRRTLLEPAASTPTEASSSVSVLPPSAK